MEGGTLPDHSRHSGHAQNSVRKGHPEATPRGVMGPTAVAPAIPPSGPPRDRDGQGQGPQSSIHRHQRQERLSVLKRYDIDTVQKACYRDLRSNTTTECVWRQYTTQQSWVHELPGFILLKNLCIIMESMRGWWVFPRTFSWSQVKFNAKRTTQ